MAMQHSRWRFGLALAVLMSIAFAAQLPSRAAAQTTRLEDVVIFAMPGGPAQDSLQKCIAGDFTKRFNVRIEFLSIQNPQALARVLAQRNNPTIDVIFADDGSSYSGFKQGVFTELGAALIPNIANIDPKFAFKPGPGVLVTSSMQGLTYNTRIFREKGWAPPTSLRDLWDPKHKHRVGIFGLGAGSGQGLLAAAGFLDGGSALNFDAAFNSLAGLKPNLYTVFQQAPQYGTALLDGNNEIGFGPAPRHLAMKLQGDPVGFVQPVEGVISKEIYLQIVKGAPHPNAAAAFVNWMLSKEGQSCLPDAGYPPVIEGINVDPELAPYLKVQQKVIPVDWIKFQENLPALLQRWNKEIDG